MTREEFGSAYERGFRATVRFLLLHGLSSDDAQETAQAAWTRGWERLAQLRDPRTLPMWLNRVALNIHRSVRRRQPAPLPLTETAAVCGIDFAAIDAASILKRCERRDRTMLRDFYLQGLRLAEIASRHGWRENTARVRLFRARRAARFRVLRPPRASSRQGPLHGSS